LSETTQESEKAERLAALNSWSKNLLLAQGEAIDDSFQLVPASDDASFRRYFRPGFFSDEIVGRGTAVGAVVGTVHGTPVTQEYVFVDAPPTHENNQAFLLVNGYLHDTGVRVPRIYEADLEAGYLMIENFGDQLCLDVLEDEVNDRSGEIIQQAIDVIVQMQSKGSDISLPGYDKTLLESEMSLFVDWFVLQQLKLVLSSEEIGEIESVKSLLIDTALEQSVVFVHRDFHSRNLMVLSDGDLGVIDFQDAVLGPVTYDLVSLLKDCYYRFPRKEVCNWVEQFRLKLVRDGQLADVDPDAFLKWFDLMGMQRHLKCAGIFSRLNLRDGKQRYLADIPLVISYIVETCKNYPEMTKFGDWLENRILPELDDDCFKKVS